VHFFHYECVYPIPESALKDLLEDTEKDEVISMVPSIDDTLCTNCLLATLIELINLKLN
jgi:hypothetical protein